MDRHYEVVFANPTRSRASFPSNNAPGFTRHSPQVRFVLNLPEAELSSADRLFFQVSSTAAVVVFYNDAD